MAQTKRKRRSKHRGTAAGTIEARGRTGRPPSPDERKKQSRIDARERRLSTPPTWKSAATRAGAAAALMFIGLLVATKKNRLAVAISFGAIAMIIYVPAVYYMDLFLYRRRMRRKAVDK